ncbi:MAG: rRNA maturation RNase YbeY [Acidobacteriota bacterium]|nr:rRNA maturation RNase YbeY [Acidobacteriota bacterium]
MIEVVNRQRKLPIDCEHWIDFVTRATTVLPVQVKCVTVAFVSDRAMRELNRRWRRKRGTTDVLSFPSKPDQFEKQEDASLGDIVISPEQAMRQAKDNRLTLDQEMAQLILHGLLHLCGYDHENDKGEMKRLEIRLRRKLRI